MVGGSYLLKAQITTPTSTAGDTVRIIEILQGKSLREKTIDSVTSLQTIAGNVILKEGITLFYCDSAIINKRTNILEAFGSVHINQNDSIHTYSQYLKYVGADRVAFLKKDVRLTDNKGTLFTQDLEYDLKSSVGKYNKGGRVLNGKTVLTSTEGIYYANTKDIFFKKNVHLIDPKYEIKTDTLLYNTLTQITSWNTPTAIKSKNGGDIFSKNGTYDLKNGKAFFGNRTIIKDSTRTYVADVSAYDELTGIAQLEGNAVIKDSVNGYAILGNQIYLNKNDNSFLATKKPVLIFKGEGKDSTFVAMDTLYSGVEMRDTFGNKISISKDTLKKNTVINLQDSMLTNSKKDSIENFDVAFQKSAKDSTKNILAQRTKELAKTDAPNLDRLKNDPLYKPIKDTVVAGDSLKLNTNKIDSSTNNRVLANKTIVNKNILKKQSIIKASKDTAIRYFIAFHHVRIYNDSLQAVCDSLYYSSADSIFRLFKNPLVFSKNSQIAGDTIYMFTKNQQPERLYVFENGIIINKANEKMYNQFAGRTLNGYFKQGNLDYMRAKGSPAESVFYPLDNDSAYIGMNRSKGDVIDIYFVEKAVSKVKFINEVDGTLYPIRLIPQDQQFLKNYKWLDKRRPKNKLELFE